MALQLPVNVTLAACCSAALLLHCLAGWAVYTQAGTETRVALNTWGTYPIISSCVSGMM